MAEDILAELRAKEEEMEAFINDARGKAVSMREAAQKSARELRARSSAELDERLKERLRREDGGDESRGGQNRGRRPH